MRVDIDFFDYDLEMMSFCTVMMRNDLLNSHIIEKGFQFLTLLGQLELFIFCESPRLNQSNIINTMSVFSTNTHGFCI